ncbi:hypothetical protein [Agrococcus casei]|uniref:Putative integral membrane protein n=1 Tax=Agrococcus casei LMG 22410 TaxID=1255656 RepID=A0A1R4FIU1_9MICO|nr:hypothetical protein [Agrococcus casei]SJM55865.1 putative integral membrane protein [Agrococcus casei LMG 22410]
MILHTFTQLLPGILLAAGVALIVIALVPTRPRLSAAIERVSSGDTISSAAATDDWKGRVGLWTMHRTRRLPDLGIVQARDLSIIGITTTQLYYQKALCAIGLALAPVLLGAITQFAGMLPFTLPALAAVPLFIVGWFVPDLDARTKAKEARAEFTRAAAVYLELVATEIRRSIPPALALEDAARIGNSWIFTRIQQRLAASRLEGVQPWQSLEEFATEIDVNELGEVGNIVRTAGERGTSVYEPLMARGRALRLQMLSEYQEAEHKRSESFSVPTALTAVVFVGMLIAPLLLNMLSST